MLYVLSSNTVVPPARPSGSVVGRDILQCCARLAERLQGICALGAVIVGARPHHVHVRQRPAKPAVQFYSASWALLSTVEAREHGGGLCTKSL